MAGSYLHKTPSQNPDSQTTWTISFWIKRCKLSSEQWVLTAEHGDTGNNFTAVYFAANDTLIWREEVSGSDVAALKTNRVFRDISAWYHIVLKWDTTNATAGDRMQMFINGVEEGSAGGYSTDTQPSQNQVSEWQTQEYQAIGIQALSGNANHHIDALMTHFHYTDGNAYNASSFGSTDSTTGEWEINTSPSVTYGTAGFFILKDAYSGTDQSGNSNNWTGAGTGGTTTQDSPSNVFATWNPLVYSANPPIFKYGNTEEEGQSDSRYPVTISTLAMPKSGKFYAEFKKVDPSNDKEAIGIADTEKATEAIRANTDVYVTGYAGQISVRKDGNYITYGAEAAYFGGGTFGDDDIFQIAFDGDNGAIYFGKNGTWGNSSDPTSGASKTGAVDISGLAWYTAAKDLVFLAGETSSSGYGHFQANFGNGYFGTTAISSEGTNASGIGKFEYDVPTGYTALSTKGLNE